MPRVGHPALGSAKKAGVRGATPETPPSLSNPRTYGYTALTAVSRQLHIDCLALHAQRGLGDDLGECGVGVN